MHDRGAGATPPTEALNPRSAAIDLLPSAEILRRIDREDAGVALAVGRESAAVAAAVERVIAAF